MTVRSPLLCLLTACLLLGTPAAPAPAGGIVPVAVPPVAAATGGITASDYVPGEIVVRVPGDLRTGLAEIFKRFPDLFQGDPEAFIAQAVADENVHKTDGLAKLTIAAGYSESEAIRQLIASGLVRAAEPNIRFRVAEEPNDHGYPGQWNLPAIHADGAWDVTHGSSTLTIAIVDTGVDWDHEDLASRCDIRMGSDIYYGDDDPDDDHGHGTMMAGIAAAATGNTVGIAGVAWNATIMPVKVLGPGGTGDLMDVATGIYFARDNGAHVINLSLTSADYSGFLQDAIDAAYAADITVVGAAGNDISADYPGMMDHVISVTATDINDDIASFSNHNPSVDVAAPGVGLISTDLGDRYSSGHGTSQATAHVSGAALLIQALNSSFGPDDIEARLEATADDLGLAGYDPYYGWGRIDVEAAVLGLTVEITAPAPHSFPASGRVAATGHTESMTRNIVSMDLLIDGVFVESKTTAIFNPSVTFDYDLVNLPEGAHYLTVEATDSAGATGHGSEWVYRNGLTPSASTDWYLAEGTTRYGYETWVLVENPAAAPVTLECTYMTAAGPVQRAAATIPGLSRYTINVNAERPDQEVSLKLRASGPVIAERAMYWGNRRAGHASVGANAPSTTWYLAEGATHSGFETYVLIQNPNSTAVNVRLDFMTEMGGLMVPYTFMLAAGSRYTVRVNDLVSGRDVSTQVTSTGGAVVAERAMYWNGGQGGHASLGTPDASTTWFLAEGTTDYGFEEYVLVQNPNVSAAHVTLAFMKPDGDVIVLEADLAAHQRRTFNVAAEAVASADVSTSIYSDVPVVAERSMYWAGRVEGHNSIGCTTPGTTWYLAEGSTNGFQEYVLLANPTAGGVYATLTFMRDNGQIHERTEYLPPLARVTVPVHDILPGWESSVCVEAGVPIMVERAMYWNSMGGGTGSIGALGH
ncbi:MAG: DUF5719 family protein [Candidatus Geothermincolia bacterium]